MEDDISINSNTEEIVPIQLFKPLPKQELFMYLVFCKPEAKFIWYVGGFGSGKSYIGSQAAVRLAMQAPNGRGLIARQTAVDLKATTMKTFFEVIDKRLIKKHNRSEQCITLVNGHEIYYWGLDDIEKLKSLEIGWYWIDEVNEVEENTFNVLKGRLRHKAQPKRLGMITSNSEGKNWTYKQFVKGQGVKPRYRDKYFTIKAPSNENTYLPEDYLDVLNSYTGDLYERYVRASFNVFEGQIFPDFNEAIHVIEPFIIPDHWVKARGFDHGERNPTACIWGAIAPSGNVYIYREYHKPNEFVDYHAKHVADLSQGEEYEKNVFDPAIKSVRGHSGKKIDTEWKEEMAKYEDNFSIIYGNNDRSTGFARLHKYFRIDPSRINPITKHKGSPRLFIFNTCPVLIDQLEQYKWRKISSTSEDDPKEEPRKRNDHGVDALRYLIMSRPDIELIEIPTEDKIIDARVPSLDWQTLKKDKDKLKRMIKENPTEVLLKIFNDNA
jgi:PBSX family phage terminase large subunit